MTLLQYKEIIIAICSLFCCCYYFVGLIIPLLTMALGRVTELNLKIKFKKLPSIKPHIPLLTQQPSSHDFDTAHTSLRSFPGQVCQLLIMPPR